MLCGLNDVHHQKDCCYCNNEALIAAHPKKFGTVAGWQCPTCNAVYAPWYPQCDNCGSKLIKDTSMKNDKIPYAPLKKDQ